MRIPAYCLHRPTGQAYVVLPGTKRRTVYLGPWGSPESRLRYAEVIASLDGTPPAPVPSLSRPPAIPAPPSLPQSISLADAYALWIAHARVYYRRRDGTPTSEAENIERSWGPLLTLFPNVLLASLTKKDFVAAREEMIRRGWCRKLIKNRWERIIRGLKWLASESIAPEAPVSAASLPHLIPYRTAAPETAPIRPVALADVRATQAHLNPVLRSMVELQLLTGMRPGEVRELKKSDLIWDGAGCGRGLPIGLSLSQHKTLHHGKARPIPLGASAAAVVAARLADAPADCDWVFTLWRLPRPTPYCRRLYGRSIHIACDRAGVPRWHPNQIRHLVATEVRRRLSLDDARALLGHDDPATTRIYVDEDAPAARRAAEAMEELLKPKEPPQPPKPEPPPEGATE
ncbi:tyrosine-type recombinase/integrase [Limnoglobus roseus]|uniref:Site-specific integrase n=1 Tax=Limnoglobus roseus TaxID=2598579 RepID=A0A5C1AFA0_9BACT|nr:tyrosine-type recombinase/integrase [Limnoglobus roseus]QEL16903.1 site-specific integrase [Limnoglobus roseus]